jgi:hypothetical protein
MTVIQGFVPQSGDGGVGVALISYCDQVMLSVHSDVGQLVTTTSSSSAAGAGAKAPVVPLEEAFFAEVQHLKALAQAKAAAAAIAAADEDEDDEDDETKKDK